jgi:hypothetical protein
MTVPVDIWLRGQDRATTRTIDDLGRDVGEWTDEDVRVMLEGMLRVMHQLKYPDDQDRPIALRGLSWIVNPFEEGGVVVAIEISLGAAIAGPIHIDQKKLETMIARVLRGAAPQTVH